MLSNNKVQKNFYIAHFKPGGFEMHEKLKWLQSSSPKGTFLEVGKPNILF